LLFENRREFSEMAVTGKTGADSIFHSQKRQCIVLQKYSLKFKAVIAAARVASIISSGEETVALAAVDSANALCDIFQKVASYSGF